MNPFLQPRLVHLADTLRTHIARGELAGAVTLLWRHGEVHIETIGAQDRERGVPMQRDTLFRIASMTKPVTAVAAMILVEEGKLRLDDPVDQLLPELADRKVLRQMDGPLDDTVPAHRPITLRDLLTFRLGVGMMLDSPNYPIHQAMKEAGIFLAPLPPSPHAPDAWIRQLGTLPLMHQPGERWMYGAGSDVAGMLIARAAGMRLEDFFQERIFAPLGMKDTAFYAPEDKVHRLAQAYVRRRPDGLVIYDDGGAWTRPPVFPMGSAGLVSTVDDYLAFARMMLNFGTHDANGTDRPTRILSRASVELMTTDHLTQAQKDVSPFASHFWDHRGWGFGVSMITSPDRVAPTPGRYGWDGGFGTSWFSDPRENMVGMLMTQRVGNLMMSSLYRDFWTLVYQAIER